MLIQAVGDLAFWLFGLHVLWCSTCLFSKVSGDRPVAVKLLLTADALCTQPRYQ